MPTFDTATTAAAATNANLRRLSDDSLLHRLHSLVCREREVLVDVLHHLNEVERRKLHLKLGYRSLFAYCTQRLRYSESSAGRRIQTARCMRRYPQLLGLLERGEVNITTVTKIAGVVLERDDPSLFERIRGRSVNEAEAIATRYRPRRRVRDSVRPISVAKDRAADRATEVPVLGADAVPQAGRFVATDTGGAMATTEPAHANTMAPGMAATHNGHSHCGSGSDETAGVGQAVSESDGGSVDATGRSHSGSKFLPEDAADAGTRCGRENSAYAVEQRYKVEFVAGEEFLRAFEQARSLLSFRLPSGAPMEAVLAAVLEEFIDRHSRERRRARRQTRKVRKASAVDDSAVADDGTAASETPEASVADAAGDNRGGGRCKSEGEFGTCDVNEPRGVNGSLGNGNARFIPAAVRDEVMARDGCRCSYAGPDGTRCTATEYLQIDHIRPVALGGGNAPENLRVLCGPHNRLEAERLLGGTMDRQPWKEQQAASGAAWEGIDSPVLR